MASVAEASQAEIDTLLRRNSSPHLLSGINGFSKSKHDGNELCRVCGDSSAKMHYGVLTCFGCKGFFRRALKRPQDYQCRHNGTCIVDKHERNSCRYCRFKKCLEVGMDPKAVRPDRDATGRHGGRGSRRARAANGEEESAEVVDVEWTRKLAVDMRTMLMQLMNTDVMVNSGDTAADSRVIYPLNFTVRQLLEDTSLLDGKKIEIRYEAFRKVEPIELPLVAHRRLLATIDWVDHLCDMMDLHAIEDKLTLVKHAFAPLSVFCFSAGTAMCTKQADILCQCHYGCVPRDVSKTYKDPYHLANRVVTRALNELVAPLRAMSLREEEVVLLKAILILNPQAHPLSADGAEGVADLRDRIQETLYHVVRETHPKEVASSRFGNLLLFLPSVYMIGNLMLENLQFLDSIAQSMTDPLMKNFLSLQDEDDDAMHGLSAEHLIEDRPLSSTLSHSSSTSSLDSLSSQSTDSSIPSPPRPNFNGLPYNSSCSSLPGMLNQYNGGNLNSASSMPNLGPVHPEPPSIPPPPIDGDDPDDYNLTLTPDMATGIRQAMSIAQNLSEHGSDQNTAVNGQAMEVDTQPQQQQQQQLPQQHMQTPPNSPMERPQFFISTVESTKHKFTVTTSFNGYHNNSGFIAPMQQQQAGMASSPYLPQMAAQQPLARTNSLPPHQQFPSMPVYQQTAVPPPYPQQSMDFEEQQHQFSNGWTNGQ